MGYLPGEVSGFRQRKIAKSDFAVFKKNLKVFLKHGESQTITWLGLSLV